MGWKYDLRIGCLSSSHDTLSSFPAPYKLGVVKHTYNFKEIKEGRSKVKVILSYHGECQNSLGYMKPYLKTRKKTRFKITILFVYRKQNCKPSLKTAMETIYSLSQCPQLQYSRKTFHSITKIKIKQKILNLTKYHYYSKSQVKQLINNLVMKS